MFNIDKVKILFRKYGFQVGIPILVGTLSLALVSCSNMASLGGAGGTDLAQMSDIYAGMAKPDKADVYYVQAAFPPEPSENPDNGKGTEADPFRTLKRVEQVSGPGDTILILPSQGILDGGITLKDGQSLLGMGNNPVMVDEADTNVRITNTDPKRVVGTAIQLANDNTVAGIHIISTNRHGIMGKDVTGSDISYMLITDFNTGLNGAASTDPVFRFSPTAIGFVANSERLAEHVVKHVIVRGQGTVYTGMSQRGISAYAQLLPTTTSPDDVRIKLVIEDAKITQVSLGIFAFNSNLLAGVDGGQFEVIAKDVLIDKHVDDSFGLPIRFVGRHDVGAGTNTHNKVELSNLTILNSDGFSPSFGTYGLLIDDNTPFPSKTTYMLENSLVKDQSQTGILVRGGNDITELLDPQVLLDAGGGGLGSSGGNAFIGNGFSPVFGFPAFLDVISKNLANSGVPYEDGLVVAKKVFWGLDESGKARTPSFLNTVTGFTNPSPNATQDNFIFEPILKKSPKNVGSMSGAYSGSAATYSGFSIGSNIGLNRRLISSLINWGCRLF